MVLYLVEDVNAAVTVMWYFKLCKIAEIRKFCYHGT